MPGAIDFTRAGVDIGRQMSAPPSQKEGPSGADRSAVDTTVQDLIARHELRRPFVIISASVLARLS